MNDFRLWRAEFTFRVGVGQNQHGMIVRFIPCEANKFNVDVRAAYTDDSGLPVERHVIEWRECKTTPVEGRARRFAERAFKKACADAIQRLAAGGVK